MSIESVAIVLHHADVTGTDKVVAIGIANHDGDGGAWPSVATLARYAGVKPRAVQSAIRRLQDAGIVDVDVQAGGLPDTPAHQRPNRYRLTVRCPDTCDRTAQHRVSPTTPPVADDTPPGVVDDTPPVSPATPEPSLNRPVNPKASSGKPDTDPVVESFEAFWDVYPPMPNGRKPGKAEALTVWRRLGLDDRRAAWRGAVNLAADVAGPDGTIPKHAHRYLSKATWVDWQDAAPVVLDRNGNRHTPPAPYTPPEPLPDGVPNPLTHHPITGAPLNGRA